VCAYLNQCAVEREEGQFIITRLFFETYACRVGGFHCAVVLLVSK
jgi:hypothetical protein